MGCQRIGKSDCAREYTRQLHASIRKYLPADGLKLCSDDGRVRWTPRMLVIMAILMSWQPAATVLDAFEAARVVLVRMYISRRRPGKTLGGYLEALQSASDELLETVTRHLRTCVQQVAGSVWKHRRWVVMAVDGSRIDCPRTVANEEAFGCAGRAKTGPQQFLTTIFHVGGGMVWDYRRGRGGGSERDHLRCMLPTLPRATLLLMDAGYVGYDLLSTIVADGHDVIVRIGANGRLLRKLGCRTREQNGVVYLWPQSRRREAPLVMRLVRARGPRSTVVFLLTSVLDPKRLSDQEVAQWYRRRWIVETGYRTFKQTLGKRKMLSDAPHKAQTELDWAVVGLWLLGLSAADEQPSTRKDQWSAAGALRAIRRAIRCHDRRPPSGGLRRQLRLARRDCYRRRGPRASRDWPNRKNDPPCGKPIIRTATRSEVLLAQRVWQSNASR